MKTRPTRHGIRRTSVAVGVFVLAAADAATLSPIPVAPSVPMASNTAVHDTSHATPHRSPGHGADGDTPPLWVQLLVPPVVEPVAFKVGVGTRPPHRTTPAPIMPTMTSSVHGVPAIVLTAYEHAVTLLDVSQPGCGIPVALLAAIGEVESGHAEGGRVDSHGTAVRPILGPVLDGSAGTAAISDTDHGVLDGNTSWDRAVGPMQFIPSTWDNWASDGNGDGITDPENVFDASLAAARYLCADDRDLATPAGLQAGILSYNDSTAYLADVETWMVTYGSSIVAVADPATPGRITGIVDTPAVKHSAPASTTPSHSSTPTSPTTTTPPPPVATTTPVTTVPAPTQPSTTPPVSPTPTTTPPVTPTPTTTPPITPTLSTAPPVPSPTRTRPVVPPWTTSPWRHHR